MRTLQPEKSRAHKDNWERKKGPNTVVVEEQRSRTTSRYYSDEAWKFMTASKRHAPSMYNTYAEKYIAMPIALHYPSNMTNHTN